MHPARALLLLDIIEAAIDHRVERIELALASLWRSVPAASWPITPAVGAIAARPAVALTFAWRGTAPFACCPLPFAAAVARARARSIRHPRFARAALAGIPRR